MSSHTARVRPVASHVDAQRAKRRFQIQPACGKKNALSKKKMRSAKNALSAAFRFSPPLRKTKKQYEDTCIAVCGHIEQYEDTYTIV